MMPLYSFAFVVALLCAGGFYRAGEREMDSGIPWCGLSVIVSAPILLVFNGGILAIMLGQVGLLMAITLFRMWRDPD